MRETVRGRMLPVGKRLAPVLAFYQSHTPLRTRWESNPRQRSPTDSGQHIKPGSDETRRLDSRSNQAELPAACATEVDLNHRPRPPKGNQPTTARVTNERMRTRSADRRGLRLLISSQVTDQRRPAHHDMHRISLCRRATL